MLIGSRTIPHTPERLSRFHEPDGNVTQAKTLFEAVSTALDWLQSDFWRGLRPACETGQR
jgi:hypothetical protein